MSNSSGILFTPRTELVFLFRFSTMQKTKKSIAKRFKVTGTGRLMRRKAGKRHLLRKKSTKQRRAMRQDQSVSKGFQKRLEKAIL
ncbi:large subunit ribosomal protein L35 [Puniceicoccus vermicola]|nr:50S ribosomal protein L35 [Puniceicoccus vermicola]